MNVKTHKIILCYRLSRLAHVFLAPGSDCSTGADTALDSVLVFWVTALDSVSILPSDNGAVGGCVAGIVDIIDSGDAIVATLDAIVAAVLVIVCTESVAELVRCGGNFSGATLPNEAATLIQGLRWVVGTVD